MPAEHIILETCGIEKRFPKVLANHDINIRLYRGEILALLGENGAGKSTLMNILYGLLQPTAGKILFNGEEVRFKSPREAISHGLGMVHQHFMLVENFTVTENLILGSEPGRGAVIDYRTARNEVKELSQRYGLKVDPDVRLEDISVGLQQRVEILKALYRKASVLILDEPTAVLTPQEVEEFFSVVRRLRDSGVSIIIITHKLEEVKAVSERVYILRRGKISGECVTSEVSKKDLATMMVGREVVLNVNRYPHKCQPEPVFALDNLYAMNDRGIEAVGGITIKVHPGEIVGIAGVDGNGQTELAEVIMGLRKPLSGKLFHHGDDITDLSTKQRIKRNMGCVPADRHRHGLVLPMTISENIAIGRHDSKPNTRGIRLDYPAMNVQASELINQFDIRAPGPEAAVEQLSGGNQQKVILAREFSRQPSFLLVNQPTRGLDVGAIEYIHAGILRMRDRDTGLLLISLELEEIFALSDRILVIYGGRIVKEMKTEETNENEVGLYMTQGGSGA